MKLSNMFKKTNHKNYISLTDIQLSNPYRQAEKSPEVPRGLMMKCGICKSAVLSERMREQYHICPKCGHYFPIPAMERLAMVTDPDTFEEWDRELNSGNPLHYKHYEAKLQAIREKTGLDEAVTTGRARMDGHPVVLAVCDSRFMMASMGRVVGEKLTWAIERATEERLPLIVFACSGGARMQEGIHSLMQMTKTSAALKRHHDAGLLYVTVLTHPTTGGVTASFAMLGDVILAEPGALIGFAGPRVIEQTIGQKLPKGFQRSEFLLAHGFVDQIVERDQLKETLIRLIELHEPLRELPEALEGAERQPKDGAVSADSAASAGRAAPVHGQTDSRRERTAWERVELSRKKDRPVGLDYIGGLFTDFTECHGDRYFRDDPAIVGGIARFHGLPVTVIAQEKGRSTRENVERNFGMPSPEGYRKALRLMRQAEKFGRPVICFVDTPGAFCGLEAEERGQGEAIARNLFEMSALKVPILSVVIGEGGSGGALAMATADEVWMLENAIYAILSPEGFASILWKDSKRAREAAGVMKLTASDLKRAGIVEQVFDEPEIYTVENMEPVLADMDRQLAAFMKRQLALSGEEVAERRYQRFRSM